jgi:predicted small integral membrane protein
MTLQIVFAANNNIIAISFLTKTRTFLWNDTVWGTRLGISNISPFTAMFTSPLILSGMPYRWRRVPPRKEPRYPLDRKLNGLQSWSVLGLIQAYFRDLCWYGILTDPVYWDIYLRIIVRGNTLISDCRLEFEDVGGSCVKCCDVEETKTRSDLMAVTMQ